VQKGVEDETYKLLCEHRLKETEEEKSFFVYELVDEIYKQNSEYKFVIEQSTENINNSRRVAEISNIHESDKTSVSCT
jgi:3-methyladenine DNA glycosylase AlkC